MPFLSYILRCVQSIDAPLSMLTFLVALEFVFYHRSTITTMVTLSVVALILAAMMLVLLAGGRDALGYNPSSWVPALRNVFRVLREHINVSRIPESLRAMRKRSGTGTEETESRGRPAKRFTDVLRRRKRPQPVSPLPI